MKPITPTLEFIELPRNYTASHYILEILLRAQSCTAQGLMGYDVMSTIDAGAVTRALNALIELDYVRTDHNDQLTLHPAVIRALTRRRDNLAQRRFKAGLAPEAADMASMPAPRYNPPFKPLSTKYIVSPLGRREGSNDLRDCKSRHLPGDDK